MTKKIFFFLIFMTILCFRISFAEMVSASSRIHIGTILYNQDGSVFGKVVDIDDKHVFPNGKIERGVLVDFGGTSQWVVRDFIINSKFVKTDDSVQKQNDYDSGSRQSGNTGSSNNTGSGSCCCGGAFLVFAILGLILFIPLVVVFIPFLLI
jgi:hypothetical protein